MWNLNWVDTPPRQKQLWFSVILNSLLLTIFVLTRLLWPGQHNPAVLLLTLSYLLPVLFSVGDIYSDDRVVSDERDLLIQKRGRDAGFLLMSGGIYLILLQSQVSAFPWVSALLVVWLSSRVLTESVQLRIYAGHEAWWPDRLIERLNRRRKERIRALRARIRP
jgi:hypothetical protein